MIRGSPVDADAREGGPAVISSRAVHVGVFHATHQLEAVLLLGFFIDVDPSNKK